ncbi:MAG: YigZ family protein [Eubacteriales bacterium]
MADKEKYVTLGGEASAELVERKSVFIGHAAHIADEAGALEFIKRIKHERSDATHNVYAYVTAGGAAARYSDDGEPQGTAGIPVLDVIRKSGFTDAVIVVTRYFGGILLGAGGLVRAYGSAAKLAVDAAKIVTYERFTEFTVSFAYTDYGKAQYEAPKYGVRVDNTDFGVGVVMRCAVKAGDYPRFAAAVAEMTSGRAIFGVTGERWDK